MEMNLEMLRIEVKNAVREALAKNVRSPGEIKRIIDSSGDSMDAYLDPGKYGITAEEQKLFADWEKNKKEAQQRKNEKMRQKNMSKDYKALHP